MTEDEINATVNLVMDARAFRYMVTKADPSELVRRLGGSREIADWRRVLEDMEDGK